ncbi:Retrovirus-related Pol polyprotein from transposon TNT 1-94 [Senna tora]|uniref:Retrovirus-related Pol polyprotein from transposon TNT 1-94 n=1 Tax=Senna tora TaxID=362788 RepID=A0A834W825_9FABA|nr:Retrovirus-related Pol polyprotein from transposon TNT 1-94 [Senna tora]
MLAHALLPLYFWEDAFLAVVFIISRYVKCIFIVYSPSHKGYKCLAPSSSIILFLLSCSCYPLLIDSVVTNVPAESTTDNSSASTSNVDHSSSSPKDTSTTSSGSNTSSPAGATIDL